MKKQGFTLIELLGVLVIFGVICALAIPPILNQVNKNKGNIDNANLKVIGKAGELYYGNQLRANSTYCVKLQDLVDQDLLKSPVTNYQTGANYNLAQYLKIVLDEDGRRTYSVLNTGTTCTNQIAESGVTNRTYTVGEAVYLDPTGQVKDCFSGKQWTSGNTSTTCYKWYVMKDNTSSVDLILDHNIGTSSWINEEDFTGEYANIGMGEILIKDGPVTAQKN